ncbi:hypothetical protein ACFE04_029353 [Oxalis oulophora]
MASLLINSTKSKLTRLFLSSSSSSSSSSNNINNDVIRRALSSVAGTVNVNVNKDAATLLDNNNISNNIWWGAKDYLDYRKSLYGEITHKALLVDAVGTLLAPSQPMAQIYREIGEKYGVEYTESEILNRYRWAYQQPWGGSRLRYVNDGKPFWQYIVSSSTGCSDSQYFEELYNYYTTNKAWHLCDPEAEKVFLALRKAGVKIAVVSNFDTRLRPVLRALNCDHWFDAVAVSAEVSCTKNWRQGMMTEVISEIADLEYAPLFLYSFL